MKGINYLLIITQWVLLLGACSGSNTSEDDALPNIVLIVTDDQGWGDLSIHGNVNIRTPNIDSLAYEGASFTNFYVQPVCSPTRAELLTGRYHPRSGVYSTSAGGERMDLDETTIAEVFQQAGYHTGVFGKWHNGMQYPYHPNGRGFDEFYGFASGHWGDYFSPKFLERNGRLVQGEGYIVNDLTDKALSFIDANQDEPFFAYIPYNTPHSPMQVPDRWWNQFEGTELEMHHRDPEKEDPQFTRAALAMVENIDWNVGRLNRKLDRLGLKENTIVLYISDNGPNSWRWNGGMRGRKGSTDEGGVRSPLFVRWPGKIEAGKQVEEVAGAIDLMPTLADLAGIDMQTRQPVDGKSLKPLLLSEDPGWQDRLLFAHWRGRTSVRTGTYRLDHEGRLYDIRQDRGQRRDVSDQFPELAKSLRDTVARWEQQVIPEHPEAPRPFPVGHPDFRYTQLPARDGAAHGNIERSNRFPNASFFTNWTSKQDSITWDVEVINDGKFTVDLYYTCRPEDVGSTISLSFGSHSVETVVGQPHDPPLEGMEHDRVERIESYVKDFKPLDMGTIELEKGRGTLTLKASEMPGDEVADVRLLMLTRIE
ncbi:arylsulfatase [Halalkalibaculum sp. DA384]|uniref:arylsulfatase n=1 Tax=Halalkalibaculum sp. DA384 TaxID=3373606 RepID=UPI003754F5A9